MLLVGRHSQIWAQATSSNLGLRPAPILRARYGVILISIAYRTAVLGVVSQDHEHVRTAPHSDSPLPILGNLQTN